MTGREALNKASRALAEAGQEDGGPIARLLLQETLGEDAAGLLNSLDRELDAGLLQAFEAMTARAVAGEPAQYIVGHWDFYGRTFRTDRRALIPRPETELLVEAALTEMDADQPLDVFDAGCGTGCIGITVKLARPQANVVLGDVSLDALMLAETNAALLHVEVQLIRADMRLRLPDGPYDVILSNPPYITTADMAVLSPVVREHEPALALDGGADGLDYVRALVDRAGDSLKPGGRMFIEVGYDQAERAISILTAAGMEARALPDYSGILRVIAARKVMHA